MRSPRPWVDLARARAMVHNMESAATSSSDLAGLKSYQEAKRLVTENEGPRDGHQFHFSVACQGASSVVGDPDSYRDDDWIGEPFTVTVRAHSLPEACRKAALLDLAAWAFPAEDAPDGDTEQTGEVSCAI